MNLVIQILVAVFNSPFRQQEIDITGDREK